MPIEVERKLKATAKARGYSKRRTGAYVYGTLNKLKEGEGKSKKKKRGIQRASSYRIRH